MDGEFSTMNLKDKIKDYPDFPKKGILFRDISPILKDPLALATVMEEISGHFPPDQIDFYAGIESRGFPFACALAVKHQKGMVMIRKQGKLPGDTMKISYSLEYGGATMEIQKDAISKGQRILICDDLLATGGTAQASARLIEKVGGVVVGFAFVVELKGLQGAKVIERYRHESLVTF